MKSLSKVTMGEIWKARRKALGEDFCNVSSYEILSKRFLQEFFEFDVCSANFEEILNEYRAQAHNKNFPIVEDEFYKYICRKYLDLESLPREKLTDLYISATQDLESIDKTLQYLKEKKEQLNREKVTNDYLKAEDRYYIKLIEHYQEKNAVAKNDIIAFLTEGINNEALKLATRGLVAIPGGFFSNAPYSYARRDFLGFNSFDIDNFSDVLNKFLELPVSEYQDVLNLYKNNKSDFFERAEEYIEQYDVVENIKKLVLKSHFLHEREEVFDVLLRSYENGDFITFNHITPLQIEGLFGDCCLALGVSESKLDISSLNEKLKHIKERMSYFYFYEYYAFKFPVIRNNIAHGKVIDNNHKHLAQMLLLDLYPVCEMLVSDDLPVMKSLSLLKDINNSTGDSVFNSLIEWLDLSEIDIPSYYDAAELIEKGKLRYQDEEFWRWLEKKLLSSFDIKNSDVIAFVKKLKLKKIAVNQCNIFFSSIQNLRNKKQEGKSTGAGLTFQHSLTVRSTAPAR